MLRISAVSLVSNIVLLLGKLFIVVTSTLSGYLYMDYYYADQLNGLYVVTIAIFVTSLLTSGMFNEVFGMAISTILQCFVTDEELFEVGENVQNESRLIKLYLNTNMLLFCST